MGGSYGPCSLHMILPLDHNLLKNTQFYFWETLDLPDLSRLMNNLILYNPI